MECSAFATALSGDIQSVVCIIDPGGAGSHPGKSGTLLGQLGLLMGITLVKTPYNCGYTYICIYNYNIWLVVWNMAFIFSIYIGKNNPN